MKRRQPKIPCPFCHHYDSLVKATDSNDEGGVDRTRECQRCYKSYVTEEKLKTHQIWGHNSAESTA